MALRVEVNKRNYELEQVKYTVQGKKVRDHPLLNADIIDGNQAPLGAFGQQNKNMLVLDANKNKERDGNIEDEDEDENEQQKKEQDNKDQNDPYAEYMNLEQRPTGDFESWEAKKVKILAVFRPQTENQEIVLGDNRDRDIDRPIRLGKGKSRMDQLEKRTTQSARTNQGTLISARDFTQQLEKLNREMKRFWEKEDKVACMRIAIQCAKLLNDVETPLFYPQKFILLTDILDNFGSLVYGRMKKLTKEHSGGKIIITEANEDTIDYTKIPDKVREVCMNWFLKSACIREVLPRIYLELALVSCHRFIQRRVQQDDLIRLSKMIRGIAEPLCATYTCAYLARVGHSIDPNQKEYLMNMVEFAYKHYNYAIKNGHAKLSQEQYFSLFEPTIDWLFQCLGHNASKQIFIKVYEMYEANPKKAIYLKSIIRYFPCELIASATTTVISAIKEHFVSEDDKLSLIKEMGLTLIRSPPKKNQSKLDFINFGWDCMNKATKPDLYMDCANVLVEFAIKNLNQNSVNLFIKEIFRKFQDFALSTTSDDDLFKKLEFLLVKVMMTAQDFSELIGFENLLGLLNYFPVSVKNKLCEMMLKFFVDHHPKLQDGFLIHSIFQIAKTLHDKIDSMSSEDEIKRISKTICKIIRKIDFGREFDKTYNVYTTARGLFINLDDVTETLITSVIGLAAKAHAMVKGKHSQKTLSFVKGCIAYSHITIPTLESIEKQIQYFFLTAEIGLLNGLLGETDSLLKGVLATMDENFKNLKPAQVTEMIQNMLGFLVLVPSNPETAFFQIVEGILSLLKNHNFGKNEHVLKTKIYVSIINYLATQQQDTLPYHLQNVDSNDSIFIGNDDFKRESNQLLDYCFDQILETIEKLNETKQSYYPQLFEICILAANTLVQNCAISKKIDSFVNKMFKMADGYLSDNNKVSGEKINRNVINSTFENFRKKKEAFAQQIALTSGGQQQQQQQPRASVAGNPAQQMAAAMQQRQMMAN